MLRFMKGMGIKLMSKVFESETFRRSMRSFFAEHEQVVNRIVQMNLSAAKLNGAAFSRFKGVNQGKDVILFATGPSLSQYKPIDGCVKVGVNHAFLKIPDLDYYFAIDNMSVAPVLKQLGKYRVGICQKFLGINDKYFEYDEGQRLIRESDVAVSGAQRFVLDEINYQGVTPNYRFVYDVANRPLVSAYSVVFVAMQFILWTSPRRVYLVGCDCSSTGHFMPSNLQAGKDPPIAYVRLIEPWRRLKEFVRLMYPETEIISVNPVGLRGLFKDIDQRS